MNLNSKGIFILLLCILGIYFAIPWNIYQFSTHLPESSKKFLPGDYRFGLDLQ